MNQSKEIYKILKNIQGIPTSHGNGLKQVLLSNDDTDTSVTQIACTTLMEKDNVDSHIHPTMDEYFIFLSGSCDFYLDQKIIMIIEPSFIRVPAGVRHSLTIHEKLTMITIGIAIEK